MKKILFFLVICIFFLSGCSFIKSENDGIQIHLSDEKITVDDASMAVYSANDIVFYLANQGFTYGEGTQKDEHEQSEADAHTVVHITKPGTYVLSGKLSLGQIAIDLGKEAKNNPKAVVTLILDNIDITCTVAPAIIFYNVYECGNTNESNATKDVDTSNAGANVIISDGSVNTVNGSYVARIYKSYELSDDGKEVVDSKKLHKYDGAFYSTKTLNINGGQKGDGILNINAENEGLNSELHLTINGGNININSGNDGINTNEDNVSVTTVNGGTLNILCNGGTGEGDGIDSNGWLIINGGTVISQACATSADAGIDSDKGIYINGGKVIASGNMLDHIAGGEQTYAVFNFANRQNGNNTYTLKDSNGKLVGEYSPTNAFTYLIVASNELIDGKYTFWQNDTQLCVSNTNNMQGGMHQGGRPNHQNGQPPQLPNGEKPQLDKPNYPPPEFSNRPENMTPPTNNFDVNIDQNGEKDSIFIIVKGGKYFSNISPVA